ncbi:MAG: hypothetical protein WDO18_19950 [Acidobacteriota bacterium]
MACVVRRIGTFYRALLAAANPEWQVRLVVPSEASRYEAVSEHAGIHHVKSPRAPFSPDYRVLYPTSFLLPRGPVREILRQEQPQVVEVNDKYTWFTWRGCCGSARSGKCGIGRRWSGSVASAWMKR